MIPEGELEVAGGPEGTIYTMCVEVPDHIRFASARMTSAFMANLYRRFDVELERAGVHPDCVDMNVRVISEPQTSGEAQQVIIEAIRTGGRPECMDLHNYEPHPYCGLQVNRLDQYGYPTASIPIDSIPTDFVTRYQGPTQETCTAKPRR